MERKTTSIKVNPELWEEVKINCIRQKIDISNWLEQIIKENLGKPVKKQQNKTENGKHSQWLTL
jgi:hypothetical protein